MFRATDITAALADLGVADDDVLFAHSTLRSSLRIEGDTIGEKVRATLDGLAGAVGRGLLVMPTFTYSYCRGEKYDVAGSPSTVGALTETFRTLAGVQRTRDPLFSAAVDGNLPATWASLLEPGDTDAFGERSVFALLREARAKLLFYGVGLEFATYVHHLEQRLGVPYRYAKDFHGTTVDGDELTETTARYFVRDLEGDVIPYFDPLQADLIARDGARTTTLPDGPVLLLTDTAQLEDAVLAGLETNPLYLIRRGHPAR